jgi:hypothetical protein
MCMKVRFQGAHLPALHAVETFVHSLDSATANQAVLQVTAVHVVGFVLDDDCVRRSAVLQ